MRLGPALSGLAPIERHQADAVDKPALGLGVPKVWRAMLRSLASAPWCSCYRSQLGFPTSARERDRALVVPIRYEQGAHVLLTRLVALAFLLVLLACSRGGDALPGLGINVGETSVSGLSAGAYMAGQLQVAHSKQIVGAGIVAGGPFGCA